MLALLLGCSACDRQQATQSNAREHATASVTAPASAPVTGGPALQTPPQASSGAPQQLAARLHLPAQLAPGKQAPVLLVLHGLGGTGEAIEQQSDLPAFANQQGIAWLAPNGPLDSRGRRFWDAGSACCNFDDLRVDHVAALTELLQRTLQNPGVDASRVFVVGYSNGGFMAHRLACERPDLVKGVISMAGAGPLEPVRCQEPKGLRVLEIHGDADPIVTYQGGHLFKDPKLPEHASAQKTSVDWGMRLGCREKPVNAATLDLDARLPGNETQVTRYEGCSKGAIELWTVMGGNHYLGLHAKALKAMWNFLNP